MPVNSTCLNRLPMKGQKMVLQCLCKETWRSYFAVLLNRLLLVSVCTYLFLDLGNFLVHLFFCSDMGWNLMLVAVNPIQCAFNQFPKYREMKFQRVTLGWWKRAEHPTENIQYLSCLLAARDEPGSRIKFKFQLLSWILFEDMVDVLRSKLPDRKGPLKKPHLGFNLSGERGDIFDF